MNTFLSKFMKSITPYVPGEQPRGRKFIKLNTNESPFPPPKSVLEAIAGAARTLNLYSDPECTDLRAALGEYLGVAPQCVSLGNGSDENLAFIFMAYCDDDRGIVFPDITYGYYPVIANLIGAAFEEIPLRDDFTVGVEGYIGINKNIVIANPNAPTGLTISNADIARIAESNPNHIVVIDEAYADFAGEGKGKSAVSLTERYKNLIVVTTYSKSRFLAGARLGYTVACEERIAEIERVRASLNPYNINSMTLAAGAAALRENEYYRGKWAEIISTREMVKDELRGFGFEVTDSRGNFVFCRKPGVTGKEMYVNLRENGFLVRSLSPPRIRDWLRITVGKREDMEALIRVLARKEATV